MIKIRTMKQVPSSRTIASFRACRTISRANQSLVTDQARMMTDRARLLAQDAHRQWLNGVWQMRQ